MPWLELAINFGLLVAGYWLRHKGISLPMLPSPGVPTPAPIPAPSPSVPSIPGLPAWVIPLLAAAQPLLQNPAIGPLLQQLLAALAAKAQMPMEAVVDVAGQKFRLTPE